MTVYEDPHAWLRPFYNKLSEHPAFSQFAPANRFAQLLEAVAVDYPRNADEMRKWSSVAQLALVHHLATSIELERTPSTIQLWRAMKGDRELHCIARHLPTGVDLQVFSVTSSNAASCARLRRKRA